MKVNRAQLLLRIEAAVLVAFMAIPALLTFTGGAKSAEPAKPVGFQGISLGNYIDDSRTS